MAESRSKLDKKEREQFLRDKDFVTVKEFNRLHGTNKNKNGKGSHEAWVHKESGKAIILPSKPANGTWNKIAKTVAQEHAAHLAVSQKAAEQFKHNAAKLARKVAKAWKKDVSQRLRVGSELLSKDEFVRTYKDRSGYKSTQSFS